MSVKNLYILPVGRCGVAAWMLNLRLHGSEAGNEIVSLPVWTYLIDTTDGPILVDTGMPDESIDRPDMFRDGDEPPAIVPQMGAADAIVPVLQRVGYKPEDLRCLVSTHWHFDHAGGNRHFPNTEVVVQKAEYASVFGPVTVSASGRPEHAVAVDAGTAEDGGVAADEQIPFWITRDLPYRLVDGDMELVPGVELISTPGHSAGHQSLLVRTSSNGNILLTIDAAYTEANYEEGVPFTVLDEAKTEASIDRLKTIAKDEKAFVFYGHDTAQAREVRVFPKGY